MNLKIFEQDKFLINPMPVWQGVREKFNNPIVKPLKLGVNEYGIITQEKGFNINYEDLNYTHITTLPGMSEWSKKLGNRNFETIKKASTLRKGRKKLDKVLEIGAGNTYLAEHFLKNFSPNKYTIIDPCVQEASNTNLEVIKEYFKATQEKFGLILGFNVIEHVSSAEKFLKDIYNSLEEDGLCLLTIPDIENQFNLGDINAVLHEHISYFTKESFNKLARMLGFEILYQYSEKDLMSVLLEKKIEKKNTNFMETICKSKELLDLYKLKTQDNLEKLSGILDNNRTKKIGFHGATNGLNTFFFVRGFKDENVLIFDGDNAKHEKFLPCFPKEILDCNHNRYLDCDIFIISAMTFYDEIFKTIRSKGIAQEKIYRFF